MRLLGNCISCAVISLRELLPGNIQPSTLRSIAFQKDSTWQLP